MVCFESFQAHIVSLLLQADPSLTQTIPRTEVVWFDKTPTIKQQNNPTEKSCQL